MRSMQHRRSPVVRAGSLLLAVAPLVASAACSGSPDAAPPPSTRPPVHRSSAPAGPAGASDRPVGDQDALASALISQWTPAGYRPSPVASGAEWASEPATGFDDGSLTGRHLFQIACSGNGAITVHLTDRSPGRKVPCGGKAAAFPFSGPLHVLFEGEAANRGRSVWRVLSAA